MSSAPSFDALTLFDDLQARGATLTLDGPTLYVVPREILTDDLRAEIRRLKPELVHLVEAAAVQAEPEQAPETPAALPQLYFVWRDEFGQLRRTPRRPPGEVFDAGAAYDPVAATEYALSDDPRLDDPIPKKLTDGKEMTQRGFLLACARNPETWQTPRPEKPP